VGLWTVRVRSEGNAVRDAASYADEISRMVDLLGPRGVAFGTDLGGASAAQPCVIASTSQASR